MSLLQMFFHVERNNVNNVHSMNFTFTPTKNMHLFNDRISCRSHQGNKMECINLIMKCQVYKSSYVKTVYKIIITNYKTSCNHYFNLSIVPSTNVIQLADLSNYMGFQL